MTATRPRTIAALDVPADVVEADAKRTALAAAYQHQPEPLEGEFAALACTHPDTCACDEDYPGWAEQIAEAEEQNRVYRQVARWNAAHPVGTAVTAYPGIRNEQGLATATRSRAWVLGGHTAVVMVDGYAGGIALTHIDIRPGGRHDRVR